MTDQIMPAQRPPAPDAERPVGQARQHSIAGLLHRTAQRAPDKIAIVYRDRRQTYADLDAMVSRTAAALAARGVAAGDRVADRKSVG